jgi:hypothetical protein
MQQLHADGALELGQVTAHGLLRHAEESRAGREALGLREPREEPHVLEPDCPTHATACPDLAVLSPPHAGRTSLLGGTTVAIDVLTPMVIDRPRREVASFAGDSTNAPKWYVNIKSVEWKTAPPLAVGSRVAFVAHFLGRRLAYTYEIVELVAETRLVMRTAEGPFPMETTYTWDDAAAGSTLMTLRNRGQASGFSTLWAPFIAGAMKRATRKDLGKLKALLER